MNKKVKYSVSLPGLESEPNAPGRIFLSQKKSFEDIGNLWAFSSYLQTYHLALLGSS